LIEVKRGEERGAFRTKIPRMKLEAFAMERLQSEWENRVAHNLSESGVHPLSVGELLGPAGTEALLNQRLVYIQSNGTEELRARVAALHPGASVADVTVCNGGAEANFIAAWRVVEPGDDVVMVLPNYMQLWGVIRSFGARVVGVPLREEAGWAPDLDELSRAVTDRTRLIIVCNPNNPTGAVLSEEARAALVEAAGRHGAWILADEVYRGAERDGVETTTLWGRYHRLMVTGGLSKAYGLPGLRLGWVLAPAALAGELWARKDYLTISPGAVSDLLGRRALDPAVRPQILSRTRGILQRNYPVLESWVARRGDRFRLVPPRAGAIAYLRYAWPVNSTELVTRLRDEQSVLVVPGDHFGMDGYLRVGFGNEPEDLRAGLARIDHILDRL
jgi:aspartate/methionine/tyrosine aminotransferase